MPSRRVRDLACHRNKSRCSQQKREKSCMPWNKSRGSARQLQNKTLPFPKGNGSPISVKLRTYCTCTNTDLVKELVNHSAKALQNGHRLIAGIRNSNDNSMTVLKLGRNDAGPANPRKRHKATLVRILTGAIDTMCREKWASSLTL